VAWQQVANRHLVAWAQESASALFLALDDYYGQVTFLSAGERFAARPELEQRPAVEPAVASMGLSTLNHLLVR